ncbi:unnamed protein product [Rotaria sordida]|uniref:NAD(P)(+)--arginine ADP-ribosyltransferase n=2 Tax=Rotaria sordida TaxID=392033 RepID=A0A815G1D4_9BILA|nr:unnamed protein product [Rotaria sordida]CAF3734573.1 unnamed protein product [Rotaria sordida]
MTDGNLETYSLIWLDASVIDSKENIDAQQQLRSLINHLKVFEQVDECEQYIRSVSSQDRIVLVVSGRLGQQIVPRINQLRQVSSIYVYCTDKKKNEQWAKEFAKVNGVITQLDELISQIKLNQAKKIHSKIDEPISISIFNTSVNHGQSTSGLNGQFLHSQLLIDALLRIKPTSNDKNELISVCQKEYKDNKTELNILREFQQDYVSHQALWWYTRESFLYRLLNKALRTQNIDLLFLFRFFMRDIEEQLVQYQCSSPICLYRGQLMSNEELQTLKSSIGQLISMNSFLSTSTNRQLAISFLQSSSSTVSDDLQQVLFKIEADPQLKGIKPFANITSLSYFPGEDEVLMMLGSIFRLFDIYRGDGQIWIIHLILCSENDHDLKPIFDHMQARLEAGKTSLYSFGQVLRDMGKFDEAMKYIHRFLNGLPRNHQDIALCYHALGVIADEKGDYDSSLEWHHKALDRWTRTLKPMDPRLGDAYNCLAVVYRKKGDYVRALDLYEKALIILRRAFNDDHLKIAMCLNNIGVVYYEQKQYSQALDYYEKALAIWQRHLPANHSHLGAVYNNIGEVHRYLGQYDLALKVHNLSLNIYEKSLSPQHPDLATTYENIGLVYEQKGDIRQALTYLEKAAAIFRHALLPTNPDVIRITQNIERVLSKQT